MVEELIEATRGFHSRGWTYGTGGNFSILTRRDPLQVFITASGVDKGNLSRSTFVLVEEMSFSGQGVPSAETDLHLKIYEKTQAQAVMHTHSIAGTVLSERFAQNRQLKISGLEMLKGLAGVTTHEHTEVIPILPNSQDMSALSREVDDLFATHPTMHGFLLAGHGLTTWGRTVEEAKRHVEILEFLLAVQLEREKLGTQRSI